MYEIVSVHLALFYFWHRVTKRSQAMEDGKQKKPISAEKLAANRRMPEFYWATKRPGQGEIGPKFVAARLLCQASFPTSDLRAEDGEDYEHIVNGLVDFYQPWVLWRTFGWRKLLLKCFASARLLGHEQHILAYRNFEPVWSKASYGFKQPIITN